MEDMMLRCANHFGLEQAQPLIHLAADKNAISKPLISVEGPASVTVSIIKPLAEAGSFVIRLRSVSDKDEPVKLSWPAGIPKNVNICDREEIPGQKITDEVTVPAGGFLTLKAVL